MPPAVVETELAFVEPLDLDGLLAFLAERAVAGVEVVEGGVYRRTLDLPGGVSTFALGPRTGAGSVACELRLADVADAPLATRLARAQLDLDADPVAVAGVLGEDPLLRPAVERRPGVRVPGHVDGPELAVRAVLGQQVSVAAARTLAARLTAAHGAPLPAGVAANGTLTHAFPRPDALAALDPETLPMPRARGRALVGMATALAAGDVDLGPGADPARAGAELLALKGIGPWTVDYLRMRLFHDRDAFLATDLGVRRAFERVGLPGDPRSAAAHAERWRPFRAYGQLHLWATP